MSLRSTAVSKFTSEGSVLSRVRVPTERLAYAYWCVWFYQSIGVPIVQTLIEMDGGKQRLLAWYLEDSSKSYLAIKVLSLYIREKITVDKDKVAFVMEELERVENGVSVYDQWRPSRKQRDFLTWVIEHSATIRAEMSSFSFKTVSVMCGVPDSTLRRWYNEPRFVGWVNNEMMKKFGMALTLLKGSVIAEALSNKASFDERKFALELSGEYNPKGKNTDKEVRVIIMGKEVNIGGSSDRLPESTEAIPEGIPQEPQEN